ncbi:MAG: DUF1499 domain-containing protein [Chlorobium sp.]|nr:MAG: DUF1499 domain-containing protein [Chlorobium sp.]
MDIINDAVRALTTQLSGLWPQPAENPHLVNGKLRACPGSPNCVSSESSNPIDRIEPISFKGSQEEAWAALKEVVTQNEGTVRGEEKEYLWSIFVVPVFGFIDDVEFRLSPNEGVIHVRSASRLGFSDLGVNRGRVEQLRAAFRKLQDR